MMDNPYVLRRHNQIIAKNSAKRAETTCYALYEIFVQHSEFLKDEDRNDRLQWVEVTLTNLMRSGMIFLTPFPPDPSGRLEADRQRIPERMPRALKEYYEENLEKMLHHIKENSRDYRLILVINVRELSGGPLADWLQLSKEIVRDPVRRLEWRLGGRPFTLSESQWERFQRDEAELYEFLRETLGARRLTYSEVDYLLERFAIPGVEPPQRNGDGAFSKVDLKKVQVMAANPAETVPVFEDTSLVPVEPGVIRFQKVFPDRIRTGFFSYMVILRLPRGQSVYPHVTALFPMLQLEFPYPSELILEFAPLKWSILRKKNKRKRKSQATEEDSAALSSLGSRGAPLFRAQISIRVWAETLEELYERRQKIAQTLKRLGYEVVVPVRQLPRFFNTLPGNPRKVGHQYMVRSTSDWLAALGPMDGIMLGDRNGVYIGDCISFNQRLNEEAVGVPVLFDIRRGSREEETSFSPAIIHYGSPGSGKSTLANYLLCQDVLRGSQALVFDRKHERWAWMFEIPAFQDAINLVTLDQEDKGKLDPLMRIEGDPATDRAAIQAANHLLKYLAQTNEKKYAELAIAKAVDRVVDRYLQNGCQGLRPSMHQVLEVLREYVDGSDIFQFQGGEKVREWAVHQVAEALDTLERYHRDSPLIGLLFGKGSESRIDDSKPITILQVKELSQSDDEEGRDPVVHTAVGMAICDLMEWFLAQKSGERMVVYDELDKDEWVETETLRQKFRQLLQKGRSTRNIVQLIARHHQDIALDKNLDEESENELGTRFVYRTPDAEEARKALTVLGMEPDPSIVEYMCNMNQMESGTFLMRDVSGNVGLVRFPLKQVDSVLYEAFRTDENAVTLRETRYGWVQRNSGW